MEDNNLLNLPAVEKAGELQLESNDLTSKIIDEKDPDKVEDLTKLFLLNKKKKDIARMNRLSNLLERVDYEAIVRFTTTPESFDNDQLLKYIDSTQKNLSMVEQSITQQPVIQINAQQNITNNFDLNQDSRKRVLDFVNSILSGGNNNEEGL